MLSQKMEKELNDQINREMYSAYLYMSMSIHAQTLGLKGFANWFMVQYHEEMAHAMKIYDHIHTRGGKVELKTIDAPPADFSSALDMFEKTLKHEQFVTSCIYALMDTAISEKDHASQIFLQWFVSEQVEEEENDTDMIAQLKLVNENAQALLMLDREIMGRMATVRLDFSKPETAI